MNLVLFAIRHRNGAFCGEFMNIPQFIYIQIGLAQLGVAVQLACISSFFSVILLSQNQCNTFEDLAHSVVSRP